jgi:hypothetical protein
MCFRFHLFKVKYFSFSCSLGSLLRFPQVAICLTVCSTVYLHPKKRSLHAFSVNTMQNGNVPAWLLKLNQPAAEAPRTRQPKRQHVSFQDVEQFPAERSVRGRKTRAPVARAESPRRPAKRQPARRARLPAPLPAPTSRNGDLVSRPRNKKQALSKASSIDLSRNVEEDSDDEFGSDLSFIVPSDQSDDDLASGDVSEAEQDQPQRHSSDKPNIARSSTSHRRAPDISDNEEDIQDSEAEAHLLEAGSSADDLLTDSATDSDLSPGE